MCAIENLARICRHHPRSDPLRRRENLIYGGVTISLEGSRRSFTFNGMCAVVRGLAEFMTARNWWVESYVEIVIEGIEAGNVLVWNPDGGADAASIATT